MIRMKEKKKTREGERIILQNFKTALQCYILCYYDNHVHGGYKASSRYRKRANYKIIRRVFCNAGIANNTGNFAANRVECIVTTKNPEVIATRNPDTKEKLRCVSIAKSRIIRQKNVGFWNASCAVLLIIIIILNRQQVQATEAIAIQTITTAIPIIRAIMLRAITTIEIIIAIIIIVIIIDHVTMAVMIIGAEEGNDRSHSQNNGNQSNDQKKDSSRNDQAQSSGPHEKIPSQKTSGVLGQSSSGAEQKGKFTVVTDHQALVHFSKTRKPDLRFNRLKAELRGYEFDIVYRRGLVNSNVDALSRNPVIRQGDDITELPRAQLYELADKQEEETNVLEEEKDHPPGRNLKFGPDEKKRKKALMTEGRKSGDEKVKSDDGLCSGSDMLRQPHIKMRRTKSPSSCSVCSTSDSDVSIRAVSGPRKAQLRAKEKIANIIQSTRRPRAHAETSASPVHQAQSTQTRSANKNCAGNFSIRHHRDLWKRRRSSTDSVLANRVRKCPLCLHFCKCLH
ncbi:unnamed protein product [Trichogramma brassicae]|uniref:Reverse transcriptase RNase H-like domain-containing protein n=1 Tax=Trichogramma brassicae TaxID=86971 RepID=A0A6H5HZQ2_9HYME|nr:unnamed protein product [Trichogramma brassicae]